jgi:hypothetical protein
VIGWRWPTLWRMPLRKPASSAPRPSALPRSSSTPSITTWSPALLAELRDTATKVELTGVRSELAGLRGEMVSVERRLLRRVGGLIVALIITVAGVLFAALRHWLPLAWLLQWWR